MRVELTGRISHLSWPSQSRDRKLAKVHRVLNDSGRVGGVIVTKEKVNNVVEITLHARGERFLHAVAKATTWETAMTDAVAKIMQQTEKVKESGRSASGAARRRARSRRPAQRAARAHGKRRRPSTATARVRR